MKTDPRPGHSVEAAIAHHAQHGDMDGSTCLLSACAMHYPVADDVPRCTNCDYPLPLDRGATTTRCGVCA